MVKIDPNKLLVKKRTKIGNFLSRLLNLFARHTPGGYLRARLEKYRGVRIGKNVWIGAEVYIDAEFPSLVVIEDEVKIMAYSKIVGHGQGIRNMKPGDYPANMPNILEPVWIKRGAWIAISSTIIGGVTIGEGAVVAAGSVVMKDVPDYTMVAGNPARPIKKLPKPPNYKERFPFIKSGRKSKEE